MDAILQDVLKECGKTTVTTALGACLAKLLSGRRKKQLTTAEEAQVHKAAENIIQVATMDDVRRYSPAFHRVSSAAKKGAAKRVGVKKAVAKRWLSIKLP
jgi:RecJ-like exonuclease